MKLGRIFCALCAMGLLAGASTAFGLTAVVGGSGTVGLEVPGFNGQFELSTINSSTFSGTATGITSDGTTVARLTTPGANSSVQRQLIGATGSSTLNLGVRLDDIAYTNGVLYGVVSRSDALQIVQINGDGTTTNVLTQPMTTYTGQWRLSGQVSGSQLVAFRSAQFSGETLSPIAEIVNPTTASSTALPVSASVVADTVINTTGTAITFIPATNSFGGSTQTREQLPLGIPLSSLATSQSYGNSVGGTPVSDEFSYSWDATHNAVVNTGISTTTSSSWGQLYRTPFVWTGSATASLSNGVTPDGTTLSNVQSSSPFHITAPTTMQQTVTPQAPSTFSARTLGSANFSVDLNGAPRGVYTVDTHGTVTADYAHDGTTDTGRAVNVQSGGVLSFAYDPISANIIGNGDFELSHFGWDDVTNPSFVTSPFVIQDGLTTNHVPWITGSDTIRQILQESTANGPMLLSFDYRLDPFPGGTFAMDVTLAGKEVAHVDLNTPSSTYSHYSVLINDPTLENLSGADFQVQMTANGSAWSYLDNFSLVAAPEPTTGLLLAIPAAILFARRTRGGKGRIG